MSTTNIFEQAARAKLRFETSAGLLSAEDLFDLPLTSAVKKPNLDDIAKALHKKLRDEGDAVSFVTPAVKSTATDELRFEIVKHVIAVRIAERDAAAEAKARADKKQKLLELIDRKQNQQLEGQTLEELQAQLAAL